MISIYGIMPAMVYFPVGIYLYIFFKRLFSLFVKDVGKKRIKILSAAAALGCIRAGWRIYGLGAVIVLHLFAACIIVEIMNLLLRRTVRQPNMQKYWSYIYRSGILSICLVCIVFGYGFYNMKQVKRTEYSLVTEKRLPHELKIAQISDLHAGTAMNEEELEAYCGKIQKEQVDLLVLTGDIFDEGTSRDEMVNTVDRLSEIQARYGTYYIFGNHDYNYYRKDPNYTVDELRNTLQTAGIHVIEDEAVKVTPEFTIIGRRDASLVRKDIGQLLTNDDHDSFILLLDHQPIDLEENAGAGVDLQLSGHTHAGQIWPTGQLGQLFGLVEQNYGLVQKGSYHAIVSSGIAGWGYPIRTGGHSEYVIITVS